MLLWFKDLMNVNEEVTMHKSNVSIDLSSAFIISFSWKFQGFKDNVNTETSRRENFFSPLWVWRDWVVEVFLAPAEAQAGKNGRLNKLCERNNSKVIKECIFGGRFQFGQRDF